MASRKDDSAFWKGHKVRVDDFEAAFDKFIKEVVPGKVLEMTKEIAFDVLDGVTSTNPVLTGHSRANWNVGIGDADLSVEEFSDKLSESEAKNIAIQRGAEVLSRAKPYEKIVVSNNVKYITNLEMGSSKKSPDGMLGITLDGIRTSIESGVYS